MPPAERCHFLATPHRRASTSCLFDTPVLGILTSSLFSFSFIYFFARTLHVDACTVVVGGYTQVRRESARRVFVASETC